MSAAIWTPKAELDLEDILYYIRVMGDRPLTAERIGEKIVNAANEHATTWSPGSRHPLAPAEWRYVLVNRWLVFYQPHPLGIEVMRVIDGARDLPRALND